MAGFDFKKVEEKVLGFWEDHKIFEKSLEQRAKAKRFVFFEGPPTANGRAHIGHFLTRIFKDLYGRYKTMRGYYVLRKAGWDTHGLPVELEVEKELGLKNKKQIEEYGIAKFNTKARESVWKYKSEWENMTRRMGFWIDLKHPYVTYETPYIESAWTILKKIWDKKLLYQAHRVVPFCTRCGTPLSSHEVAQGYDTVTDKSVTVKFLISNSQFLNKYQFKNSKVYILAWTTTPWTLPGNVALAVGEKITYVVFKVTGKGAGSELYIAAKDRLPALVDSFEVVQELMGKDLVGLEYEPLFDISGLKSETAYKVYAADFVSTTDGTGVVHTAVMYGEDDYNLGTRANLPKVHTVTEQGKFIGVSEELDGTYVKDPKTEARILEHLRSRNLLLKTEDYEHEYPFCWRCKTPLLYYAKTSWFIKMSAVREQLLKNNQKINWAPEHIREGRFGQWLKEGKDWALSRERYWGTPLPIWECIKCDAKELIGSLGELEKRSAGPSNNYYFMRHGLSTRNEQKEFIVSSRIENDTYVLTPEGIKQVTASAEQLKHIGEEIDVIYASPFKRTLQTAEIAAKILHASVEVDERLSEIRHSLSCEGKDHVFCPFDKGRTVVDQKEDDGESYNDVRQRLMNFMRDLESQHREKKVLIITHGDPLWILNHIAYGADNAAILADTYMSNPQRWYPGLGMLQRLEWRNIPRNEVGELDPHRPFVDDVVISCAKCGADMHRIRDLIDCWFDSGAMPYAQWHWPFDTAQGKPFDSKKMFKEQFPADFIVEAIDQTRGWFYTLLAISTLLGKGPAYKNVMVLGLTLDEKGRKMSKSVGNVMPWSAPLDSAGVDATRWHLYSMNAPSESKILTLRDFQAVASGFVGTLYNCLRFYELYKEGAIDQAKSEKQPARTTEVIRLGGKAKSNLLDAWILSRLHGTLRIVTERLDAYDPMPAARAIQKFVLDDFSNWWLRRSRKRKESLPLLRQVLLEVAKMLAPFVPFTSEELYLQLKGDKESVHLDDWSKASKKFIKLDLEAQMERVQEVVQAGLAIRKEKQIKVRQPLSTLFVNQKEPFSSDLEALVKDELNVKNVVYQAKVIGTTTQGDVPVNVVEPVSFNFELSPELKAEGHVREVIRQIQDMRKEAGYGFNERVYAQWYSDDTELTVAVEQWADTIKEETILSELVKLKHDGRVYDVEKDYEIAPGKKIWLGIKK